MRDINSDRAIPMRWQHLEDANIGHSVLIVERGYKLLVGYDVPTPFVSYDESKMTVTSIPWDKLGPDLAWRLLREYEKTCNIDPLQVMRCQLL